jgi:hypothetical protein
VHGIVTAHQGFVRIDAARQRGTTVTVLLPLEAGAQERSRSLTPVRITAEGRGRILVVEDEEAIRALIVRHLSRTPDQDRILDLRIQTDQEKQLLQNLQHHLPPCHCQTNCHL